MHPHVVYSSPGCPVRMKFICIAKQVVRLKNCVHNIKLFMNNILLVIKYIATYVTQWEKLIKKSVFLVMVGFISPSGSATPRPYPRLPGEATTTPCPFRPLPSGPSEFNFPFSERERGMKINMERGIGIEIRNSEKIVCVGSNSGDLHTLYWWRTVLGYFMWDG